MKNLTAKNIHKYQSQDGYAWNASFYLDGKPIGKAHNGGHGGPTNTRDIDPDALKVLEAYAAKTPPHNDFDFEQVEALLESVMWDTLDQRDSKRKLKSHIVARLSGEKHLNQWKIRKGLSVELALATFKTKYSGATILNEIPFEDAHKILITPTD